MTPVLGASFPTGRFGRLSDRSAANRGPCDQRRMVLTLTLPLPLLLQSRHLERKPEGLVSASA